MFRRALGAAETAGRSAERALANTEHSRELLLLAGASVLAIGGIAVVAWRNRQVAEAAQAAQEQAATAAQEWQAAAAPVYA